VHKKTGMHRLLRPVSSISRILYNKRPQELLKVPIIELFLKNYFCSDIGARL